MNEGVVLPKQEKATSPLFSYFAKPITNTTPEAQVSMVEVFNLIRGDSFKPITSTLQGLINAKEARMYKAKHFSYVTFSGTFSMRNDASLLSHSGILAMDLDHVKDLQVLKDVLLTDPYFETELIFISPSGDGLKWIIPIDLSEVLHKEYFRAVSNYIFQAYKFKVDPAGSDVSRACFLPHDPEVYINPKYI